MPEHRHTDRSARQVAVGGGAAEGLALCLAPADDDAPGDGLQRRGGDGQHADGGDVGGPPPLLHAQDGHALEDVDDAQHDHRVPHRVVVHVPVRAVLVLLLRPQEQRQDLDAALFEQQISRRVVIREIGSFGMVDSNLKDVVLMEKRKWSVLD